MAHHTFSAGVSRIFKQVEIYMDESSSDSLGREMQQSQQAPEAGSESLKSARDEHTVEALIGELRQRTEELEQANRELRRVSHYRSLFLARMSHELRTPLTSILGFSEILLDQEQLTDTQRRFCQKVQDSGLQLQASLNQLVDLSRIEAGQTEVFFQEFSLRETLRESFTAVARMAQKQQVKIENELGPEISTIVSDQGKLRQILFNFIAWAVSRSPADDAVKVTVGVDGAAHIMITISDHGEPVSEIEHAFDPPEANSFREANINELGLIIGRRLLDLIDGTVVLQNRDPVGLEMAIRLPARPLKG